MVTVTEATAVPARAASPEHFAGTVWQEPVGTTPVANPVAVLKVSFMPGARTNWHTHPLGQTLHVLAGIGLVQARGAPARLIRPGDSVWIAPGEEHWHGAAAAHPMTHLAVQHVVDGYGATWLEPVSDDDYAAAGAG